MITNCNWLSPKCKSQLIKLWRVSSLIVTDYRLNANHNNKELYYDYYSIVTDYRLNANHNLSAVIRVPVEL